MGWINIIITLTPADTVVMTYYVDYKLLNQWFSTGGQISLKIISTEL